VLLAVTTAAPPRALQTLVDRFDEEVFDVRSRRARIRLTGDPPDLTRPVDGCVFYSRCWKAPPRAETVVPPLEERAPGHWSACLEPENVHANGGRTA